MDIYLLYADTQALKDLSCFDSYYRSMPFFRKEKIDRIRTREGKMLSLGAGILLKIMREEAGADPSLEPKLGEHGKPYYPDKADPIRSFNLSHSGSKVMACYTLQDGCQLGCDVERMDRKLDLMDDIAARFFSVKEQEYLRTTEGEEKRKRFYRIWTLKESFVKATGCGILRPLDSFSILLPPEQPGQKDATGSKGPQIFLESNRTRNSFCDSTSFRYSFREFSFDPEYCWSLCLETDPSQIREERFKIHCTEKGL